MASNISPTHIGVLVYQTDGGEAGERFRYIDQAEEALRERGFIPRDKQPDEWVALRPQGNVFASVRPAD